MYIYIININAKRFTRNRECRE